MSKENQNSDFDVAVRKQKAFDEATREKVSKHQVYSKISLRFTTLQNIKKVLVLQHFEASEKVDHTTL